MGSCILMTNIFIILSTFQLRFLYKKDAKILGYKMEHEVVQNILQNSMIDRIRKVKFLNYINQLNLLFKLMF